MIAFDSVIALFPDLDRAELIEWIEWRWVQPELAETDNWIFHPVDVARLHLIYDLRRTFETPPDTMPLVLSLLDQVYDLRSTLKAMTQALAAQPLEVQLAIKAAMQAGTDV